MRHRNIFIYSIILIIFLFIVLTYPFYRKQINLANKRIVEEGKILNTKYGNLEYSILGEGKPVLLIHGAGGGYDQGLWLGELILSVNYKFIAPSKFGYLNSQVPENISIKIQIEQYKYLLEHLNIKKVVVVGISSGGISAMQFANDYPEMTDKLILLSAVSMPPNQNDKDQVSIKFLHLIQKSDYAYWLMTKLFKKQLLDLMGISSDVYNSFSIEQKNLAEEMLNIMHPMSLRYKGTIIDGELIEGFDVPGNIETPTLIIHSKNDGLVSYLHAENANKKIKDSKIILYENGGHGALSELSNLRKEIEKFLNN